MDALFSKFTSCSLFDGKTVVVLAILLISTPLISIGQNTPSSTCLPEGIKLTTQSQVDSFPINYPGCSSISASLEIVATGISNLDSLAQIESIEGSLIIIDNTALTNLRGLENLSSIGGDLDIRIAPRLIDLEGLNNLNSVSDRLIISQCLQLENINALAGMNPNSFSELIIVGNPKLSDCAIKAFCDYLTSLTAKTNIGANGEQCSSREEVEAACAACIPEGLTFTRQSQIDSFPIQYPSCSFVNGNVSIIFLNEPLSGLDSLYPITSIKGNLIIQYANGLEDLEGLQNLTFIGNNLDISFMESLKSLKGLESLQSIRRLQLIDNPRLKNLKGLDNLSLVKSDVLIRGLDSLTNLEGLESLTTVRGAFRMYNLHQLSSLSGLEQLTSINDQFLLENLKKLRNVDLLKKLNFVRSIKIVSLDSLENLNGFENLTAIRTSLRLLDCPLLKDISGLRKISPTSIEISGCPQLSICDFPNFCKFLAEAPDDDILISGNAEGCATKEDLEMSCKTCLAGSTLITTQNQVDSFPERFPLCTDILGDLVIDEQASVSSLQAFSQIHSVGGSLSIGEGSALTSLKGLENLTQIQESLSIIGVPRLNNLKELKT